MNCADSYGMKTFLLIVVMVLIVFFVFRYRHETSDKTVAKPVPADVDSHSEAAHYLKDPLDRTHAVIDQVQKQRKDDNY